MSRNVSGWILYFLLYCNYMTADDQTLIDNEEKLQSDLIPKNYWRSIPPKSQDNLPVLVSCSMLINTISSVTEEKMEFEADLYLRFRWTDYRFRSRPVSNATEPMLLYNSVANRLWWPSINFRNSKARVNNVMNVSQHIIYLRGQQVDFMAWPTTKFFCAFQFYEYPFDVQHCSIQLMSETKSTKDVFLEHDISEEPIKPQSTPLQLEVMQVTRGYCNDTSTLQNFSCLELRITFHRRLGNHMTLVIFPSILIVMVSWFSFWLDVDAVPARISLGVTSLLTLITIFSQTQRSLPPVSYLKAIDIWMLGCILQVFCSLVEFIVTYSLTRAARKRPSNVVEPIHPPHPPMLKMVNDKYMVYPVRRQSVAVGCWRRDATAVDRLARTLFPVTFILFNLVYWFYFANRLARINS